MCFFFPPQCNIFFMFWSQLVGTSAWVGRAFLRVVCMFSLCCMRWRGHLFEIPSRWKIQDMLGELAEVVGDRELWRLCCYSHAKWGKNALKSQNCPFKLHSRYELDQAYKADFAQGQPGFIKCTAVPSSLIYFFCVYSKAHHLSDPRLGPDPVYWSDSCWESFRHRVSLAEELSTST